MSEFNVVYSGPDTPSADGHRFTFGGTTFPHRRAAPVSITYHRRRLIKILEDELGVTLPITGRVHIAIEIEPTSTHRYDLDNVIGAMFQVLDGSTLTQAGRILESDKQIVSVEVCEVGQSLLNQLKTLEDHLEDCVQDRLSEINAEAEAYDRDASKTLAQICESIPGFDWNDWPEGLTTEGAYDTIMEHIDELGKGGLEKLKADWGLSDVAIEGTAMHHIARAILNRDPLSEEENQQLKLYALAYAYGYNHTEESAPGKTCKILDPSTGRYVYYLEQRVPESVMADWQEGYAVQCIGPLGQMGKYPVSADGIIDFHNPVEISCETDIPASATAATPASKPAPDTSSDTPEDGASSTPTAPSNTDNPDRS